MIGNTVAKSGFIVGSAIRNLAIAAASVVVAASGLIAGAGQASASESTVSGWNTASAPVRCSVNIQRKDVCLYYSPGAEGAMWWTSFSYDAAIDGTFSDDGYGSAGAGQQVRNNAASAENSTACRLGIWVYPNYVGDVNWVPAYRGGNLTSNLRNNEASIGYYDPVNCPGVGVDALR
ncbi:peptidase inhibitor family I36 protein [Streptomyces sp. NBC_01351]|uniref:peptidase inhibitor family I36 protein n=1 Tax=Streptomyces sp. NBC_01351 TaxID=2903833 RepID=UPI002E3272B9|nr:peptidase inhibitor family I36 protein [Streptomyces sp. NBC_01351]